MKGVRMEFPEPGLLDPRPDSLSRWFSLGCGMNGCMKGPCERLRIGQGQWGPQEQEHVHDKQALKACISSCTVLGAVFLLQLQYLNTSRLMGKTYPSASRSCSWPPEDVSVVQEGEEPQLLAATPSEWQPSEVHGLALWEPETGQD